VTVCDLARGYESTIDRRQIIRPVSLAIFFSLTFLGGWRPVLNAGLISAGNGKVGGLVHFTSIEGAFSLCTSSVQCLSAHGRNCQIQMQDSFIRHWQCLAKRFVDIRTHVEALLCVDVTDYLGLGRWTSSRMPRSRGLHSHNSRRMVEVHDMSSAPLPAIQRCRSNSQEPADGDCLHLRAIDQFDWRLSTHLASMS
jgi:hypothetical protein